MDYKNWKMVVCGYHETQITKSAVRRQKITISSPERNNVLKVLPPCASQRVPADLLASKFMASVYNRVGILDTNKFQV